MDLCGIEERTDGRNSSSTGSFAVFISSHHYCRCSSGVAEKLSLWFSHTNWTCRIKVLQEDHGDTTGTWRALMCEWLHVTFHTVGLQQQEVIITLSLSSSSLSLSSSFPATLHPPVLRNVINLALTRRSCSRGRLSCYWTPLNSISASHDDRPL